MVVVSKSCFNCKNLINKVVHILNNKDSLKLILKTIYTMGQKLASEL